MFKSKAFIGGLEQKHHKMSLSGVDARGENGVTERLVQTNINSAITMMMNQALMWPGNFDIRLWPFALYYAA